MKTINLKAHFDGEKILLDEPFDIEPDTKLIKLKCYNFCESDHANFLE